MQALAVELIARTIRQAEKNRRTVVLPIFLWHRCQHSQSRYGVGRILSGNANTKWLCLASMMELQYTLFHQISQSAIFLRTRPMRTTMLRLMISALSLRLSLPPPPASGERSEAPSRRWFLLGHLFALPNEPFDVRTVDGDGSPAATPPSAAIALDERDRDGGVPVEASQDRVEFRCNRSVS